MQEANALDYRRAWVDAREAVSFDAVDHVDMFEAEKIPQSVELSAKLPTRGGATADPVNHRVNALLGLRAAEHSCGVTDVPGVLKNENGGR